jgi:hypothetical protein
MPFPRFLACVSFLTCCSPAPACDLCAIYGANDARGESSQGLLFTVAELFVPFRTLQFEGEEVVSANPDFLDRSITHLVPGYNFSKRFGVGLNVPLVYQSFQRSDVRYALNGADVFFTERGSESGLGDIALIGRFAVLDVSHMKYGIVVNVLGGVKFPTGDSERLKDEVQQSQIFEARLPPGTPHDPLGHSRSFVHQHDLALGSGSFDGIMGLTLNGRWQRWFFNSQFQYYWRTEGESSFQYGNELMLSGGPGCYLLLNEKSTLSLQANAAYETHARDRLIGRKSDRTEMTAWYVGPQILFTSGNHFSALAGADLPVRIENNGPQAVADYRFHGSVAWRF